jgi:hypothetical protein
VYSSVRIAVISWAPEAPERAGLLAGDDVSIVAAKGPPDLRPLLERPPDDFVLDLERRPSEGRSIGVYLRQRKATRNVPLVFAGGAGEQPDKVQRLLPDAIFTGWDDVAQAVEETEPPTDPVVPGTMDAYSGIRSPCSQTGDPDQLRAASACSQAVVTATMSMPSAASAEMFAQTGSSSAARGTRRLLAGGSGGTSIRCIASTKPANPSAIAV